MSETTTEIFTAFAKFQGELSNASKDKKGHGYMYASLAQCIDGAKDPLSNNGLAVTQLMGVSDKGTTLTTMLTHASGQWFRSHFLMEKATLSGGAGKNPAQGMGASITYMRRYAYAAIIGMAQEDTDAESPQKSNKRQGKPLYVMTSKDASDIASAILDGRMSQDEVIKQLEQDFIVTDEIKNTIKGFM